MCGDGAGGGGGALTSQAGQHTKRRQRGRRRTASTGMWAQSPTGDGRVPLRRGVVQPQATSRPPVNPATTLALALATEPAASFSHESV